MYYRSDLITDPHKIVINKKFEFGCEPLRRDIEHLARLIQEDNKRGVKAPLLRESMVVAILGGWGIGKTWACWAFINKLKTHSTFDDESKFHVFNFDLLPFSNINESVSNILSSISHRLWDDGVVDVRSEMRQMVLDALPVKEVNAGVSFFGLSLSKKLLSESGYMASKQTLKSKMAALTADGHRILVMLDDLDRMKPDEILVAIRMIENFRDVPGFIFVVPFKKEVITKAAVESLKLDDSSAHVFIRKFLKASITIRLNVGDFKHTFELDKAYGQHPDIDVVIYRLFKENLYIVLWRMLLHTLVITEAVAKIGTSPTIEPVAGYYNNPDGSDYMYRLAQILIKSKDAASNKEVGSLPVLHEDKWYKLAKVYEALSDPTTNAGATTRQLKSLLDENVLAQSVYTDPGLIDELRKPAFIPYDSNRDINLKRRTLFQELVLPNADGLETVEPLLTENYSRRDMQQIAKAIYNDPFFTNLPVATVPDTAADVVLKFYPIVRDRFLEFR